MFIWNECTRIHVHVHMLAHVHHTQVYTPPHARAHRYLHVHTTIYAYTQIHMPPCAHRYLHTHTRTHTPTITDTHMYTSPLT